MTKIFQHDTLCSNLMIPSNPLIKYNIYGRRFNLNYEISNIIGNKRITKCICEVIFSLLYHCRFSEIVILKKNINI